jgi:hypothetical protein
VNSVDTTPVPATPVPPLDELKEAFRKWRRIGWKNVCGASMGKVRDIQKPNRRRHPGSKRMIFVAGVSCGLKNAPQNN